jgi:hypothetical protein
MEKECLLSTVVVRINNSIASTFSDVVNHSSVWLKVRLVERTGQDIWDHTFHGESNTEDFHALGHEDINRGRVGEDIVLVLVV